MLEWNLPTYVGDASTNLWMLQGFTHHCSLRSTPEFFAPHQAEVAAAGADVGAGFVKLPYRRDLPVELLAGLMRARLEDEASRRSD